MKKFSFFVIATFVVMSFAACGNKTQAGGANDSDSVVVDSMVVDSFVVDNVEVDTAVAE